MILCCVSIMLRAWVHSGRKWWIIYYMCNRLQCIESSYFMVSFLALQVNGGCDRAEWNEKNEQFYTHKSTPIFIWMWEQFSLVKYPRLSLASDAVSFTHTLFSLSRSKRTLAWIQKVDSGFWIPSWCMYSHMHSIVTHKLPPKTTTFLIENVKEFVFCVCGAHFCTWIM